MRLLRGLQSPVDTPSHEGSTKRVHRDFKNAHEVEKEIQCREGAGEQLEGREERIDLVKMHYIIV